MKPCSPPAAGAFGAPLLQGRAGISHPSPRPCLASGGPQARRRTRPGSKERRGPPSPADPVSEEDLPHESSGAARLAGLDDLPRLQATGADADPLDRPVHHGPDQLEVGFELPLGTTRDPAAHAALGLGQTAAGDVVSHAGSLSTEFTYPGHLLHSCKTGAWGSEAPDSPGPGRNRRAAGAGESHQRRGEGYPSRPGAATPWPGRLGGFRREREQGETEKGAEAPFPASLPGRERRDHPLRGGPKMASSLFLARSWYWSSMPRSPARPSLSAWEKVSASFLAVSVA